MAPPRVPDDVTDLGNPTFDVNETVNEVGAESVATVQAANLRTRVQLRAAGVQLQVGDAVGVDLLAGDRLHNLCQGHKCLIGRSMNLGPASVVAPTRTHHGNDQPAAALDMNAFAQALSHSTSQHVPAANITGGKAAAIVESDKPKLVIISS